MNATLIRTRPIIKAGDALYVESIIEGQVKDGPFATSLPYIVRWLGDDCTRVVHRDGTEFRDITEELAAIWLGMHPSFTPYDVGMVPEYVKRSEEWSQLCSEYPKTPMRVALSLHAGQAGRH